MWVLLAVFVVATVAYFAFFRPLLTEDDGEKELPPETQEGESLGTSNRYQIFDQIERDNLQSIVVTNEHGTYEFYRDNNGEFQIRGHEGIAYSPEMFSELVVSAGYPLAKLKVADNADKYEEYGLNDPICQWTITDTAGKSRTLKVGHRLHTDDGYYICLEGREAVYELSQSIKGSILAPIEDFITPVVMVACTQNDYYEVDKLTIFHGEEKFISFAHVADEDKMNPDAIAEQIVTYPTAYTPNDTEVWEVCLLMAGLSGEKCMVLGAGDTEYEQYGLLEPAYTITFEYNSKTYVILISEKTADGYYYASSNINPTVISKVSADTLDFLDFDLFTWISPYVFGHYITQIKQIGVTNEQYNLTFDLEHFDDGSSNGGLNVECSNKTDFSSDDMVLNFRMFYRELISLEMQDYAPLTAEERKELIADKDNLLFEFSFTTLAGKKTEIAFYQYTTRRCLVTINGEGEFYVLIDRIEKLNTDIEKLMNGVEIDSFAKN